MPKATPGFLDSFIATSKAHPEPVSVSQEIRDRGSTFVGALYRAATPAEAQARITHVKQFVHRQRKATHEVAAWRCMVLKKGKTGLDGPDDFELVQGSKDDGESWAGGKVLKVMQNLAVLDAVVIVSRWYGGQLLGPARFSHIETCTSDVCKEFKRNEELQDCILALRSLDDILSAARKELADLQTPVPEASASSAPPRSDSERDEITPPPPPSSQPEPSVSKALDYSKLDVKKAKNLIKARENSIKAVKALVAKRRESASSQPNS